VKANFCSILGASPFDVQLSAVLVLRSISTGPEPGLKLANSSLLTTLMNLLRTQQEDDEFVLQVNIDFVFYRWIAFINNLWMVFIRSFTYFIAFSATKIHAP